MSGRTVVLTGGNSGIGFETAAALSGAGARVVICARSGPKGQEAVDRLNGRRPAAPVELAVFDLASFESVRSGAAQLLDRLDHVDVLVNNAGLMLSSRQETVDGHEATFQVNHLSPFLLTSLLLDRLRSSAPSRIVNVASTAHRVAAAGLDFDDLESSRSYRPMMAYGRSKLANILFTAELARRLEGVGVTANCLHPGTVRSGFARDGDATGIFALGVTLGRSFFLSAARGARTSVYLASSPDVEGVSGRYFVRRRPSQPSRAGRDEAAARRLWERSEELTGLAGRGGAARG